ncbi:helix-turn-helix domain-containing protein [Chelativorans xinjiangense]|uniref:helix-turn-helix domain-containing protein n=1 Tax=Chelativorans xinjiangense TaxID=2681485 RepID=UPI00135C0A1C|nr:helix-turn-helix domain-containing protein [Chelativorans xinjiangense]
MATDHTPAAVALYIQRLKMAFDVKRDDELAEKLGLSKQAVSNWRSRGRVPLRVQQHMLDQHGIRYTDWNLEFDATKGDIVYAVALYAYERYLSQRDRPLDARTRRAIGQVFPVLRDAIAKRLEGIAATAGSAETMISLLTSYLDNGRFTEVDELLSRVDDVSE